jgi:hypothetical protein
MNQSPVLLRVLLVLSIIYGAMTFLSGTMMAIALPSLDAVYRANQSLLPSAMFTMWERAAAVPRLLYAALAVLSLASVAGCVLMWNLRRSGFHLYTIAQLLMLVLPLLFMGKGYLGLGDLMFTALFVFIYYRQLKQLGAFDDEPRPAPTDSPEEE